MNWIVAKKNISDSLVKIEVEAAQIVDTYRPGHHVLLTVSEQSKPIALVVSGVNVEKGFITLLVQKNDPSQAAVSKLTIGDELYQVKGPFGEPIDVHQNETVLCVATEGCVLPVLPAVKALKALGNKVITVLDNSGCNIYNELKTEFSKHSEVLTLTTKADEFGHSSDYSASLQTIIARENIQRVMLFGSLKKIKQTWALVRRHNIPMQAYLYAPVANENSIEGIYSVSFCNHSNNICVDGENFNAYYPNFEVMAERMERIYQKANNKAFAG